MGERWDRDRFMSERNSRESLDRPDDDRYFMRGGRGDRDGGRRVNRSFDDDDLVRDRRYPDDEPRFIPRRERGRDRSPPPEFESRRVVLEKEREREVRHESPPRRRPHFLRRQSSLDIFDRPPHPIFHQREEYPPPARREDIRHDDYRAPAYVPIPLPKSRRLPPPRSRFPERGSYEEIGVAEPDFYGDDDYRPYPERIREREIVRRSSRSRRHRARSPESARTRSHRGSSRSSRSSSRSSSSSRGTTVRSEYPKKGKTRIPAKLVEVRAIIEIGYPFVKEGNIIIIQKALGQENIDFLLERSEDIRKEDAEKAARAALPAPPPKPAPEPKAKPPPQVVVPAPPPPKAAPPQPAPPQPAPPQPAPVTKAPPAPPVVVPVPVPVARPPPPAPVPAPAPLPPTTAPAPPPPRPGPPPENWGPPPPAAPPVFIKPVPQTPIIIDATPPPEPPLEIVDETIIRDYSPSRSSTTTSTSWDSHNHHHHHHRRRRRHRREKSAPVAIGPLALVERSRSRSRAGRSRSRSGRELRAEIRALERELAHRPKAAITEREIVRAERLPDGQLVVYEEEIENVSSHPKPPRIEKDKKGPPPRLVKAMLATLT